MKPVIVIADDLTGAADTGVCFSRVGLRTAIVFTPENSLSADVFVYTTESRHAGEAEARNKIRHLLHRIPQAAYFYKKIDSTLRGSPMVELTAIMDGLGIEKVLVSPAFPAQGRTTVAGKQLINGLPIERASIHPEVANSDLVELFRASSRPTRLISLHTLRSDHAAVQNVFNAAGPAIIIGDAETKIDLRKLSDAAIQSGIRLFCGSAGLAAELAEHCQIPNLTNPRPVFRGHPGPILVIAGSRNPITTGQVETARENGVTVVELNPDMSFQPGQPTDQIVNWIASSLALGQDVIVTTSSSGDSSFGPFGVAERLAQCVKSIVRVQKVGGVVLTGGDIAMAVISALNVSGIELIDEILPGIPLSILVGSIQPDLPSITKAGGFGQKDALLVAIQSLKSEPH